MNDTLKKMIETNPGIDQQIVEEFERAKKILAGARVLEQGSCYSLDLPFEKNEVAQPVLAQVLKGRPSRA